MRQEIIASWGIVGNLYVSLNEYRWWVGLGDENNMEKQNDVQLGQQYVKVHSTRSRSPVWKVNSIHPGDYGITHAGLMNLDDPLDKKTVSFSVLLDKTHYRLVSDVGAAA